MNKKLEDLSSQMLDVIMITETVRDACLCTDLYNYETVLNIAIDKQQKIYELIEGMY